MLRATLRRWAGLAAALALTTPSLLAQESGTQSAGSKQALAVRVPDGTVQLDGYLSDDEWSRATPITDFVQKEPTEGAAPSERMEVRFVFEANALYVGARMYSSDPGAIQAPLGGRDQTDDVAESITISFDTFLDRRTAYTFGVTASGARLDRFHPGDAEDNYNDGFNPVWEARTQVDGQGWTAELWIPFTQLRFNDQQVQVWGLNVRRFVPTREEEDYWVMVPRTERAWASRFGDLVGIEGIRPSRRIEVLPFVVGTSTRNAHRDLANPFDDGRNLQGRAGLDMKVGVGPNLTMDATVNPDFGQVEADPAEVNLTAFATRFPERRPFFNEGSQLLNLRNLNVVYTRRIGAPPAGRASGDFVDVPLTSRILGAAKLTGRLPSGTSIGVLGALTDQSYAHVATIGLRGTQDVRVAPRAGWGIARVQQEFGSSGSNFGFLVGGVRRDLDPADPLAQLLVRDAAVAGTDGLLRLKGGEYELGWALGLSYVAGEAAAVDRLQRSSTHYHQRPDRSHDDYDPTRETWPGWGVVTSFSKVQGRHWLFDMLLRFDSPDLEINNLGQLNDADQVSPRPSITYRETRPGKYLRSYQVRVSSRQGWTFGNEYQEGNVDANVNLTWLNFRQTSFGVTFRPRGGSYALTRGGPLMGTPLGWRANASFSNANTSQTRFSMGVSAGVDELEGSSLDANLSLSIRPAPRWQLSVRPQYSRSTEPQQYVSTLGGGRVETFGSRYVFSYIDRSTWSTQLRASFVVTPDLTIEAYTEPFAASGRYYDYGELLAPRSRERVMYGEDGSQMVVRADGSRNVTIGGSTFTLPNADFNVRTFNSNMVLRWEWRPGSTLYLVWQQNRTERETLGTPVDAGDMFRSVTAPGTNILLFKTSFWLPVG